MTNAVALAARPCRCNSPRSKYRRPRGVRSGQVTDLATSIADIGLQTPPTWSSGMAVRLGRGPASHRSVELMSVEHVPVRLVEMDDGDARMWAISENLHRAELTELQRDEQIAEYADLAEKKREAELHSAQVAQNESKRADNRGHRHEGGDARAARDLGLKRDKVRRLPRRSPPSRRRPSRPRATPGSTTINLPCSRPPRRPRPKRRSRSCAPSTSGGGLRRTAPRRRHGAIERPTSEAVASSTRRETPVNSDDAIGELARELISKCRAKAEYRTLDKMSWIVPAAKTAIAQALQRLDGAAKTREGERGIEYRIEGNPDMLLARAAVKTEPSDRSAAAADAEIDQLRAENADLRAKLIDANDEIEKLHAEIGRLKSALHEKVVEEIAAKLVAQGETKPTEDDVVRAAHLAPRMRSASQKPEGCSGDS